MFEREFLLDSWIKANVKWNNFTLLVLKRWQICVWNESGVDFEHQSHQITENVINAGERKESGHAPCVNIFRLLHKTIHKSNRTNSIFVIQFFSFKFIILISIKFFLLLSFYADLKNIIIILIGAVVDFKLIT